MTSTRRLDRQRSWGIPLTYVVVTVLVGFTLPRLEHALFPGSVAGLSAGSAMSIASAVASGIERSFADATEKLDASMADRQGLGIAEDELVNPAPDPR